jgi:hypothetical protein
MTMLIHGAVSWKKIALPHFAASTIQTADLLAF